MKLFCYNKQDRIRTQGYPILYYILSVFFPGIIIVVALAGLKITPFGDNTLAISDGHALYLNYLGYVGRTVKGEESVLYSFTKGLGGNMMGSWGWFLLNPFFALFAFFDVVNYMQAYTWVSVLNFSLCGLTMYILLRDCYGHRLSNLIFSTAYALNGFLVANVFQMNFFACVPTLPIVVLGLKRIFQNRNPLLYILSLAYSLLMNFYFGFMLCVASVLIFVVFYAAERDQIEDRKAVIIKYCLSSIIAGALSSVIWLPALLSLRGGRLDQNISYAISFKENMPFLDMLSKFFTGANSTAELSNGLPNIFVGILPVFLVILFFINKKVTKKWKLTATVLLLFYLISFYIPVFNIAMHGGTVTNWFNYRDSFVFCFFILMIAAEEWNHITEESGENLKRASIILIVTTLVVFSKRYEYVTGSAALIDIAILGLMILTLIMHKKDPVKNPKRIMTVIVLVLMCVNLFMNYYFSTKNIMSFGKNESDYQKAVIPVSATVDAVKEYDSDFYRMEIGEQWSGNLGNDPMLYGYYGVGHGGSDERNFVRTALSKLGVRRFNMRNSYGRGVPAATDALLGLKYIISKENLEEEKGYERLLGIEDWGLYRNPYALPVAVLANEEVYETEINIENIFENLNHTWSAIAGDEQEIFIEENDIAFESHNFFDPAIISYEEAAKIVIERDSKLEENNTQESSRAISFDSESSQIDGIMIPGSSQEGVEFETEGSYEEPPEGSSYIKYIIRVHREGPVYSYNRSGMTEDNGSILPTLFYEGSYHEGDTIIKYLPAPGNTVSQSLLEDVAGRFRTVYVDTDALASLSENLQSRPVTIERIKDRHLFGELTAEVGQTLMFTIPYDEGWTCWIDGEEVPINMVLGVFMAVDVPEGIHSYEMKFFPTGMKAGIVISLIGVIVTTLLQVFDWRIKKKRTVASIESCGDQSIEDTTEIVGLKQGKLLCSELHSSEGVNRLTNDSSSRISASVQELPRGIIALILVVVALIISLKSSYNPFLPYNQSTDSSVFEYVGRMIGNGKVLYRDTFDHKGPLLYFINWLGTSVGGHSELIGIIECCVTLITAFFIYRTFRQFVGKNLSIVGAMAVLLAAYKYFESGNTVEEFALPFISGGIYVFTKFFQQKKVTGLDVGFCGFCLGCVLLLRENMIALWVVFAVAVIIKERKTPKELGILIFQFLAGLMAAFLPALFYLGANHAILDFYKQYILFNFQYSDVSFTDKLHYFSAWGKQPGSLIAIAILLVLLCSNYRRKHLCVLSLLFHLLNLVFIGFAGTGFSHYGLLIIPSYMLTIAMLLEYVEQQLMFRHALLLTTLVALVLLIPWMKFIISDLPDKHINRYQNAESLAAAMIWNNTYQNDKIIVCGNCNRIYIEAEREAASKYSYQLPIGDIEPSIFEEFLTDLERNEPEVLVLNTNDLNGAIDYTNLNEVVEQYLVEHTYFLWGEIGSITVLGRHPIK